MFITSSKPKTFHTIPSPIIDPASNATVPDLVEISMNQYLVEHVNRVLHPVLDPTRCDQHSRDFGNIRTLCIDLERLREEKEFMCVHIIDVI